MGEYVNLRDYLPNCSTGTHTLAVFYTERGASGYVVSWQIASNQSARADYINTTHYELPDSGGSGMDCFLYLGIGLLALFACCLWIRLHRKKNAPDSG